MKVRLATTAEYVNQTGENRPNIIGAYVQLTRPPGLEVIPVLNAVFILQFEDDDFETEKRMRVVVFDPSDEAVNQGDEATLFIPPPPERGILLGNIVTSIPNVACQTLGTYRVCLIVNDERFHDIEVLIQGDEEGNA